MLGQGKGTGGVGRDGNLRSNIMCCIEIAYFIICILNAYFIILFSYLQLTQLFHK